MLKKLCIVVILAVILLAAGQPARPAQAHSALLSSGADQSPAIPEGVSGIATTIPAAAFRPEMNLYTYQNDGFQLTHSSTGGGCPACFASYYAPVHLPHGATVTSLTAYIEDFIDGKYATVSLFESRLGTEGYYVSGSGVSSPAGVNATFTPYTSGASLVVDNQNNVYHLRFYTPAEQSGDLRIRLGAVLLTYQPPADASASYYSLGPSDFTPASQNVGYINSYLGSRLIGYGAGPNDLHAGVNLPNNARIDQLTLYYNGAAGISATLSLNRASSSGTQTLLGSLTSAPSSGHGSISLTTLNDYEVDNADTYYTTVNVPDGPAVQGLTILYTRRTYGSDETLFSIPAASLIPSNGSYSYENLGNTLRHLSGGGDYGNYLAAISPPQGVSLTTLGFMVGHTTGAVGFMQLLRQSDTFEWGEMAYCAAPHAAGWTGCSTATIKNNPIDYRHNAYYLNFGLTPSTETDWVRAVGVRGQWRYKSYLPLGRKK